MKIKKQWVKFSLLTIVALVIGQVVSNVVTKNLINYVYPIEADSISIPILSTYLMFIFLIPFALVLSFVSISEYDEKTKSSKGWFIVKVIFYLLSYLVLSMSAISGVLYWNTPYANHNQISHLYIVLLLLIQAFFIFDLYQIFRGYKRIK